MSAPIQGFVAPGVFVEETSVRPPSIAGVPTGTTGFVGATRYGPVAYPGGPTDTAPVRVSSILAFEAMFGDAVRMRAPTDSDQRPPYTAYAARAFFANGGDVLYVARAFAPRRLGGADDWGVASARFPVAGSAATWRARWPGAAGNVRISLEIQRSANVAATNAAFGNTVQAVGATHGAVVEIIKRTAAPQGRGPTGNAPLVPGTLAQVEVNATTGRQTFRRGDRTVRPAATDLIQLIEVRATIHVDGARTDVYPSLGAHPQHARDIATVLSRDARTPANAHVWLDWDWGSATGTDLSSRMMVALQLLGTVQLTGGHDGGTITPDLLRGSAASSAASSATGGRASGLEALAEVEGIAIVALPDAGALEESGATESATTHLLAHVQRHDSRFAVVDGPAGSAPSDIRQFRARFDSARAALYFPWMEIVEPATGQPLLVPPSGAICGIYAANDVQRGVFHSPANVSVNGITRVELSLDDALSNVLNTDNINVLRTFPGRGNLVWGARTMSSDASWRHVSVRRAMSFLAHSIERGTTWAVFEPNGDALWGAIRRTIEDFLLLQWRAGALLGDQPDKAFYVRCDRSTMTQADIESGRLVCVIGVALVRPAEFIVFQLAQWTASGAGIA